IGRTYFENIRNHLINNGLLARVHGNIKRMPQWKTKMVIDKNVAEVVKNFLENYAEVHGLPSPGRSINRITQSIVFLPAEMSYKSVHRDFLAGLSKDKLKRNYYNKNTKLAEEQRKLVDQHYSKVKTQYCSIDATAHYSYD